MESGLGAAVGATEAPWHSRLDTSDDVTEEGKQDAIGLRWGRPRFGGSRLNNPDDDRVHGKGYLAACRTACPPCQLAFYPEGSAAIS